MISQHSSEKFTALLVRKEADNLHPFLVKEAQLQELQEGLREIIQMAMELDAMLGTSKAVFDICWSTKVNEGSVQMDDSCMEAVGFGNASSQNMNVAFYISPILLKRGNADGREYDKQMVLEKARVFCH